MKQTRRFSSAGYVTSEDSNSGMKEAYDDRIAAEEAAKLEGERDEKALPEGYKVTPEAPAKVKPRAPRAMSKSDYLEKGTPEYDARLYKMVLKREKAEKEANLLRDKESGRTRGTRSYRRPLDSLDKQMSESNLDMSMAQRDPEATAKFLRSGEAGNGRGSYYKSDGRAVIQKQREAANEMKRESRGMKKGGAVKKMASGGSVSSASSRGDGIAQRGKTRGKMC